MKTACLTKKRQSVTEQHGWSQVINEVQIREAPPFTVILKEAGESIQRN